MTKTKVYEHTPRILVPLDTEPDNSFVRQEAADDELLWSYIERALTRETK